MPESLVPKTLPELEDILNTRGKLLNEWADAMTTRDELAKLSGRLREPSGPSVSGPVASGDPKDELVATAEMVRRVLTQNDEIRNEIQRKRDEIKAIEFRNYAAMGVAALVVILSLIALAKIVSQL